MFISIQGAPHLVTANYNSNFLSLLGITLSSAGAPVAVAITSTAGSMPCKLAKGDLNHDGSEDLAVALFGFSSVALLTQEGSGFSTPVLVPLKGNRPNGVAIGDVLGEGKLAVLAADRDSDQVDVITRKGDQPWAVNLSLSVKGDQPADPSKMEGPVALVVADVLGDPRPDLVVTYNKKPGCLKVFTQAPPAAPKVISTSHPDPEQWYANNAPGFQWEAPADLNGIASYCYLLDQEPSTVPLETAEATSDTKVAFQEHATGTWYFHILAVDNMGNRGETAHVKVRITSEMSPENVYNYPNPSRNGRTVIRFPLPEPADVSLRIFDAVGNLVWSRDLGAGETIAGVNQVPWDGVNDKGRNVANGGYILKVTCKDKVITKKIAIIR
jgi:hypothetical protein